MCLLSMFHTKKPVLPTQGHPRGIITCHFVVPEMRHMIFYGPKISCELQKFKRLHNKINVIHYSFKCLPQCLYEI